MGFLASLEEFILFVAEDLGLSPILVALVVGGVVLSVVVSIIGRISREFGVWRKQASAANQPQTATTSKTPRQVVGESRAARVKLLFWKLVIFVIMLAVLLAWLDLLDNVLLFVRQVLWPPR